jgi:hypothetical protein
VIVKKGEPSTSRFWILGCAFHPARDGSFRDIETQHEKLAVNPRSTPGRVLRHHSEDQIPELLRNFLSADSPSHPGDQTPVQAETGAMPADHGLGSDYQESLLPSRPEAARENPEEFVQRAELGPGMLALQDRELLAKRQILQQKAVT